MSQPLSGLRERTFTINSGDIIWQLQDGGLTTIITSFNNTCLTMTHDHVTFNYMVPYTNTILQLFKILLFIFIFIYKLEFKLMIKLI